MAATDNRSSRSPKVDTDGRHRQPTHRQPTGSRVRGRHDHRVRSRSVTGEPPGPQAPIMASADGRSRRSAPAHGGQHQPMAVSTSRHQPTPGACQPIRGSTTHGPSAAPASPQPPDPASSHRADHSHDDSVRHPHRQDQRARSGSVTGEPPGPQALIMAATDGRSVSSPHHEPPHQPQPSPQPSPRSHPQPSPTQPHPQRPPTCPSTELGLSRPGDVRTRFAPARSATPRRRRAPRSAGRRPGSGATRPTAARPPDRAPPPAPSRAPATR